MSEKCSKKRKVSLAKKVEIITYLEEPGSSIRKAVEKFGVSKGVVQNAKARKAVIMSNHENNTSMALSRIRSSSEINTILYRWFVIVRSQGFPISGPILQAKCKEIAKSLNVEANASEGWLSNWKKKHGISMRAISGESGNVDFALASQWKENLNALCSGYSPKDIFNMDETGYFYRALPDKTLEIKTRACKGGKLAKDRVTLALTCSCTGETLKPIVIGKSKNPRCFRNCLLYTSPSPRDRTRSRMPSSAGKKKN